MKMGVFEGKTKVKDIEVHSIIGEKSDEALYQVVVARLSHEREGNLSTKTKSEVSGGGKKPWRQKGLGRARAGSIRSPLWRGGGVTFGPKPRDFSKTINKKQKYRAYVTIFSQMAEMERLQVFSDFKFDSHKTKDFIKVLDKYIDNKEENVVMIIPNNNKSMVLASRNLSKINLLSLENLDILPLVYADRVLISEKAIIELDSKFKLIFH